MIRDIHSGDSHPTRNEIGLYTHVPFCAKTCDFCAFYQTRPTRAMIERYFAGLEREVDLLPSRPPLETVFWGGGTPGLLTAADLERLGRLVIDAFGAPRTEWTIELAPGSVRRDKLEVLKALGVTRVSMGVQSFQGPLLEALGRPHQRREIDAAWDLIAQAGFPRTNLDLIFGIPGQTTEQWLDDLREAVRRAPDHLSTYCLTFEEDTALFIKLSQGKVRIDREAERQLFRMTWEFLEAAGYPQYEISNFARPGAECRHNLNTWRMREWIGLGPSAAEQFAGWRGTNVADLDAWLDGLARGVRADADRAALSDDLLLEDSLIFGLRLNSGVDPIALAARFPAAPRHRLEPLWARLTEQGLLAHGADGRLFLTGEGRLVADAVGAEIMQCCEDAPAARG